MQLGTFLTSLAVKDIENSKQFYEKLGFTAFGGDQSQNWLILRNGNHVVGLFQGMFDTNIMTFNPGWDKDCNTLESFTDVRKLRDTCRSQGIELAQEAIEGESGPGSFVIADPDGNLIMFDQHV